MFWMAAELPPDMPATCIERAASHYAIPPAALIAVLQQERGKLGKVQVQQGRNHYGPFQVSDLWVEHLSKWGFTAHALQHDACANATAGAYVLAWYKAREATWHDAVARYNVGSLNTVGRRLAGAKYAQAVFARWNDIFKRWEAGRA